MAALLLYNVAKEGQMLGARGITKFVCHGRYVQALVAGHGWHPAARYTNLRDVREQNFQGRGFLDINWKKYDFSRHLSAAQQVLPLLTIARDVEDIFQLERIIDEADALKKFSGNVAIVPKDPRLIPNIRRYIPERFMLAYSVPTKYGGTTIKPQEFDGPVHLLGGRPDHQRLLANQMDVVSIDCNRFTLDARYGDYFDGSKFRPHPIGGYERCLRDSVAAIEKIWCDYRVERDLISSGG